MQPEKSTDPLYSLASPDLIHIRIVLYNRFYEEFLCQVTT